MSSTEEPESAAPQAVRPQGGTATPEQIVAGLDLATKIRLLSGQGFWHLEPIAEHALESILMTDGPHGLRHQTSAGDHVGLSPAEPSTCFPTAVTLGATWDVDLLAEVGGALGEEALEQGVSVVLGPGLNIQRHPAGGRCFEYFSEDPLVSGKLAAAMVRGVQAHGVGTSAKHFAANNQEAHRLVVDAVVDERTLRELYLAGFEIVVKESAPWTVMCSYNRLNGTYASEHRELLTTILREEWRFDGLVVSDWGAVNVRAAGIRAGLDLEMPGSRGACDAEVFDAVRAGDVTDADIDRCAQRVVSLIQRGQRAPGDHPSDRDAHHQLGRRAAAAGSVLLRNERSRKQMSGGEMPGDRAVLPLVAEGRIAVVGAFAESARYQGAGSSQVTPTRLDVALDAFRARVAGAASVTYEPGYQARSGATTAELLDRAVAAAASADVVVVFAGLPAASESEGFDRTTLDLPSGQLQLIEALAALDAPVVVVLSNGGVVHLPWAERVDAVLECWLGGQAGGSAIVDVLFGDTEPGGRLAQSVPVHVTQLPADRNFPGHPRRVEYREGLYVGYRFHDSAGVPAQFAFGHGLSFTTFDWTDAELASAAGEPAVTVSVTVTNTGERRGSDVVQVYVRLARSLVHRPDKELRGFAKVQLDPGESERVTIDLDRRAFAVWDVVAHDWLVEAGDYEIVVARSSVDVVATIDHTVISSDRPSPASWPSRFVATDAEFASMLVTPAAPVPPTAPFTRNSTLEDLSTTKLGRLLTAAIVREGVKRSSAEFPEPDDATVKMVESSLREAPLRLMVLMGGGTISFGQLDGLIELFNRRWRAAVASAADGLQRAVRRSVRSRRSPPARDARS